MTLIYELPIVGAFHHPPAMALTRLLPLNAPLVVRAEPTNQFDSNAIAIDLNFKDLKAAEPVWDEIRQAFTGYRDRHPENISFEDAAQAGSFHLGFIPAVDALALKTRFPDFTHVNGSFRLGPKAKPFVKFSIGGL